MSGTDASGWKRKWYSFAVIAAAVLFGVASVAVAQSQRDRQNQDRRGRMQQQSQRSSQATNYVRIGDLMGGSAYSQTGEEIGDVENVIFDEQRQQVLYVVVAEGGFLGIGDDRHAIPWAWVTPRERDKGITLPLTEETLDEADGFEQYPTRGVDRKVRDWVNNPPSVQEWSQMTWEEDDDGLFNGDDGLFEDDDRFEMRKASEIMGMEVQLAASTYGDEYGYYDGGRNDDDYGYNGYYNGDFGYGYDGYGYGEGAGEIDDLLVSAEGKLDFALMHPEDVYFDAVDDDEYLAVPWARMQVLPEQEMAVANLTENEAMQLVIGEDEITRLNDPNFRDRLFSTVGVDYYVWIEPDGAQRNGRSRQSDGLSRSNGHSRTNGESNGTRDRQNGRTGDSRYEQDEQRTRGGYVEERRQDTRRRPDVDRQTRRGRQQQQGERMTRNQEMQQWSSFANQCLGRDFNNSGETVRGTIQSTGTLYTSRNADAPDGRRFVVTTRNNERVRVYVGPSEMVTAPLNFSRGDQVTFRGTRCRIDNQQVFVATTIESDGQTFTLEPRDGVPHWTMEGQNRQQRSGSRR